jgi:hypothetical protein
VEGSNGPLNVRDEWKDLRQHDAVEDIAREMLGAGEIGHDRCLWVVGIGCNTSACVTRSAPNRRVY